MALLKNTSTFISFTLILAIFLILILNSSSPATAVHHYPGGDNVNYPYKYANRYNNGGRAHKRDPRYGSYHPGRGGRHIARPWKYPVVATYP